ncbi:tetratricopeptide repeat protein 28-like [Oculina patagonica]
MDADSKYMCDSFRIRLIPSLTSLKLIADCPDEYHSRSGALLVGDPWVEEVTNSKGQKFLEQLEFARMEVEMIGNILNVVPLTGKMATKAEVLKRLSLVALVHIAAHGRMETGEIALTPDSKQASRIPTKEEDYILNMSDVLSVKMRARLVVLSCCHSGRGEIKAEGVVGIARAFMGAGARSVLVSLWAIDDEATMEFMRSFYHHLVEGRSASESLNQAMKDLRKSDKYSDVKYWAPFVLIGDDVTLDFHQKK